MEALDIKHMSGQRKVIWKSTTNRSFLVKSAYSLLILANPNPLKQIWRAIWKWEGLERVKSFLWTMAHDNLLTNELHVARCMDSIDICPKCGKEMETSFHALRDYDKINHIWL